MKRIMKLLFSLIPVLILFSSVSLSATNYEFIKIERIAMFNPINVPNLKERSQKIVNHYFEKYDIARSQASLIITAQDYDYNSVPVILEDLKNQNYDLAVIPFIKEQSIGIYEVKQKRKLWVLSKDLESDLELLFWILDRSLIAGIKINSENCRLGLVPGKNGDLGLYFPCSTIYYNLKQLPHIKVIAISKKKYDNNYGQLNEFYKKQKVNYILYYESSELNLSRPLITGSILKPNGNIYGNIKTRMESKTNQGMIIESYEDQYQPYNPEFRSDIEGEQYQYVSSRNFVNVAQELSHYLLAVLLTEFCFPQQTPLKLELTKFRKYIKKGNYSFPNLDNTNLSENVLRF